MSVWMTWLFYISTHRTFQFSLKDAIIMTFSQVLGNFCMMFQEEQEHRIWWWFFLLFQNFLARIYTWLQPKHEVEQEHYITTYICKVGTKYSVLAIVSRDGSSSTLSIPLSNISKRKLTILLYPSWCLSWEFQSFMLMETAFQKLQQSYWKFSKKEWRAGKTKNLTTYLKILRASVVVEGGGNKVKILQGGYKNSCNESPHHPSWQNVCLHYRLWSHSVLCIYCV